MEMTQRKTAIRDLWVQPEIKNALKSTADYEIRSLANMAEVMILKKPGQKCPPQAESSRNQNRNIRVPSRSKKGAAG
jgi:hypothetical protein